VDRIPQEEADVRSNLFVYLYFPNILHCTRPISCYYFFLLRNEKQNDFIDQIESVAYVLCGENPVNLCGFQQIFKTKGVSFAR